MSLQQSFYGASIPVVNQTNTNNASIFPALGGGGGGGVSPNLTVSTLFASSNVFTSSITGLSSINGQPYVPGGGGGGSTSLFSTASISSLTVSSINGAPYTPGGGGGAISSFNDASVSTLTVSTINGSPYTPGGGGGAISSFNDASVSTLTVSTINGLPYAQGGVINQTVTFSTAVTSGNNDTVTLGAFATTAGNLYLGSLAFNFATASGSYGLTDYNAILVDNTTTVYREQADVSVSGDKYATFYFKATGATTPISCKFGSITASTTVTVLNPGAVSATNFGA